MKIKNKKITLNTIHVVSKNNTVFMKSDTETPINFQWIPVFDLNRTLNQ